MFRNEAAEFVYVRTYSKWMEDENRRETWPETVSRYLEFLDAKSRNKMPKNIRELIESHILKMGVMPSMRALWAAGTALDRNNLCAYNCSYITISDTFAFSEVLFILMCGTGVGFSVEKQYVEQLPIVKQQNGNHLGTYIIEDSKEGWAKALDFGINAWFKGQDVEFDYSQLRPRGARLITSGGRSSGPEPLKKLLEFTKKTLVGDGNSNTGAQNRQLTSIECHDLCCQIAEVVVVGGVRRSSLISLSDLNDEDLRVAKNPPFPLIRAMANNSVVFNEKPSSVEFLKEWYNLAQSGTGERGIYCRYNAIKQSPYREMRDFGLNPCLTGDTLVYVADGRGHVSIKELADQGKDTPVFCRDNNGKPTIRYMRNPRITGYNKPVYKITLEDGFTITTTDNHKFLLKSGIYKKVKDLTPGDSLDILTRFKSSIKDIFSKTSNNAQDYYWLNYGKRSTYSEHRHIAAFSNNLIKIPKGCVVHHKDYNAQNNSPYNLEIMTKEDHDALHIQNMIGGKNPMRRAQFEWSKEKWADYKKKLSDNNIGKLNSNYSGLSNKKLQDHAIFLTRKLNRRFSTKDWLKYAKECNLPQYFSKWRKDHLGGIISLAKWAAKECEIDQNFINIDPRAISSYYKYLDLGYNCDIINNEVVILKSCEWCSKEFSTLTKHREVGYCSTSCHTKQQRQSGGLNVQKLIKSHKKRQGKVREDQIKIYSDLKFKLGREPKKKEWRELCRKSGISSEISRKSSPFRRWTDLQLHAQNYNHKVVSVEFVGYEDVYNGTVDEFHNFYVGGWEGKTKNGKLKQYHIVSRQCGEILLRPHQLCNLTEVVVRAGDSFDDLIQKVKVAVWLGVFQATLTKFKYVRKDFKKNCQEEALLGVSLTGQLDNPKLLTPEKLEILHGYARKIAKQAAKAYNINVSAAISTGKPSGSVSQVVDCASGMHPRRAPFYIRRYRISANDPLFKMMKDQGVEFFPEKGQSKEEQPKELQSEWNEENVTTWICEFPIKAPKNSICVSDVSAVEQFYWYLKMQEHWCEHNQSCTIFVGEDEWADVGAEVYRHLDKLIAVSFLPRDNGIYGRYTPEQEIDEKTYNKMKKSFPKIDYLKLSAFENEDNTTSAPTLSCTGNKCEIM